MRDRSNSAVNARSRRGASRRRIRVDLERRGVARELTLPIAARLAPLVKALPSGAYGAALDAAVAALSIARVDGEPDAGADRTADVAEIQRLMLGFTDELRKLEEGLRILSAFVLRMRTRAGLDGDGVLH
jgi:hypothetical protein